MLTLYSSREEVEVVPGQPLGVIEEYLPGSGVYVDSDGVLRAAIAGKVVVDKASKTVYVVARRRIKFPEYGSEVVGYVTGLRHDLVIVEVHGVISLSPRPKWLYETPGPLSAAIPIANIADEYIKDIVDYYRIGDLVIAKIVSRTHPFTLTTKNPQYGVLYAYCGNCGSLMNYKSDRTMVCPRCGSVEKRKVSILARSRSVPLAMRRHLVKYRYPW